MQLNEHADPGLDEIYARALEASETMSAEELRKYVVNLVKRANRRGRDYEGKKDPFAAFKKRIMFFGEEDSDGDPGARSISTKPAAPHSKPPSPLARPPEPTCRTESRTNARAGSAVSISSWTL